MDPITFFELLGVLVVKDVATGAFKAVTGNNFEELGYNATNGLFGICSGKSEADKDRERAAKKALEKTGEQPKFTYQEFFNMLSDEQKKALLAASPKS